MLHVIRSLGLLSLLIMSACSEAERQAKTLQPANPNVVRLAVVITPQSSGLLGEIIPQFERDSGLVVYAGSDVYKKAREGKADLVISHYGKHEVEGFVLEGFGSWPKMVFANQAALIGHKSDPAGVRGVTSVAAALDRIVKAKAKFVHNSVPTIDYLTNILLESIGQLDKGDWFVETDRLNAAAALLAEEQRGYLIWGSLPFLRFNNQRESSELEILVSKDPALQRIMAAIVVQPDKVPGVNVEGATMLRDFLLSPSIQAKIAAFRTPGTNAQLWWPVGRNN